MRLAAFKVAELTAHAYAHGFYRVDPHEVKRVKRVQTAVVFHITAYAYRHSLYRNAHFAAEGVAVLARLVYRRMLRLDVLYSADVEHFALYGHAYLFEDLAAHRSARHSRRRLARARAFENGTGVVAESVLLYPREIRVSRADAAELFKGNIPPLGRHDVRPVGIVAVAYEIRYRTCERRSAVESAHDRYRVRLYLLPVSPSVTALAAFEVGVYPVYIYLRARRQSFEHAYEPYSVALSRSEQSHDNISFALL